ncbi:MAG: hypothetical protein LBS50_04940 [Prevotellaceae bacterium]|jgi:hypothetical protein|nr:hypothetical protein [Prevotellaceae bacterium]
MSKISENAGVIRIYEKPETKKHDAMNTVQGSYLYYTTLYRTYYYYYTYYYTSLYYYH